VLLVTDALHSRRASATFEKAGVRVLSSPCADREYELRTLSTDTERQVAFRDRLREWVGSLYYRLGGRI
jgi:uncharacterized SAM-binding protein YcdF (DUF218 family)